MGSHLELDGQASSPYLGRVLWLVARLEMMASRAAYLLRRGWAPQIARGPPAAPPFSMTGAYCAELHTPFLPSSKTPPFLAYCPLLSFRPHPPNLTNLYNAEGDSSLCYWVTKQVEERMARNVSVPRRAFVSFLPPPSASNRAWPPASHHFPPRLHHLPASLLGQGHTRRPFSQNPRISTCPQNQGDARFFAFCCHYLWGFSRSTFYR